MVRAIIAGRKTRTMRAVTPQNSICDSVSLKAFWPHADLSRARVDGSPETGQYLHVPCHVDKLGECPTCDEMFWPGTWQRVRPRIQPGHRIWGKERVCICRSDLDGAPLAEPPVWYLADGPCPNPNPYPFQRSSLFMPRWAARLLLQVQAVAAQRPRDLTEAEALAEGIAGQPPGLKGRLFGLPEWPPKEWLPTAHQAWAKLWDEINSERGMGMDANPWSWVYSWPHFQPRSRGPAEP